MGLDLLSKEAYLFVLSFVLGVSEPCLWWLLDRALTAVLTEFSSAVGLLIGESSRSR